MKAWNDKLHKPKIYILIKFYRDWQDRFRNMATWFYLSSLYYGNTTTAFLHNKSFLFFLTFPCQKQLGGLLPICMGINRVTSKVSFATCKQPFSSVGKSLCS